MNTSKATWSTTALRVARCMTPRWSPTCSSRSCSAGRSVNVVVDSREGPTFGQTIVDWYDGLKAPKNAFWVESGDAQGFFDLLTERLARLK